MSFLDFQERYPDEASCEQKLFSFRWPDGFVCPKCGHSEFFDLPRRELFQCKQCKYQASLTAGTVMHKARTPLLKWFWAMFLEPTSVAFPRLRLRSRSTLATRLHGECCTKFGKRWVSAMLTINLLALSK